MSSRLRIESRHSDYGEDAGGYRVLRFDEEWIGRVTDYDAGDRLLAYVRGLEQAPADAAAELPNIAGPIAERIRVYRQSVEQQGE